MSIRNFASFDGTGREINDFGQLNILIGRNNQGKSNMLRAIQFLDYNKLISFLNEIPESTKKLREYVDVQSNRELSSIFHYKSSNYLQAGLGFKEPVEISYVLDIHNKSHTYKIKVESLLHKTNGEFTYVDEKGILRTSTEPVVTLYDGKEAVLNEIVGTPEEIVHPISVSALSYDFSTMKENLLTGSFMSKDGHEGVQRFLDTICKLGSDFHELFFAFGDYAFPPGSEGKNIQQVQKRIYEEKWYINAELFLRKTGLTFDGLGLGQRQTLALFHEIEMAKAAGASIITIDEMEMHMYPGLMRNVLREIRNQSDEIQFFITSHSNIPISTPLNQKIYLVNKSADATTVDLKATTHELYTILDDLGIKASDILQANGVIWVEGPSDKTMVQEWLRRIGVSETDLDQTSFVSYGGSSVVHIKFPELLNLNRNCVVVQDSDKTRRDDQLKGPKVRVMEQCKKYSIHCWTTHGREMENYFSEKAIMKYKSNHPKMVIRSPAHFDNFTDIEDIIRGYGDNKPANAREIAGYMTLEEIMSNKELSSELRRIKDLVRSWNR